MDTSTSIARGTARELPFAAHHLHRTAVRVLGPRIDHVSLDEAVQRIAGWAQRHESRYVVACNVHSIATAEQHAGLMAAIEGADLALPDGAPVAWLMRRLGCEGQSRVAGPDLMWRYMADAGLRRESVYLLGGTEAMLVRLRERLLAAFPGLVIAGAEAPPFRALSTEEESAIAARVNASGAGTVWVGLGCPKQEQFMARLRDRVHAVQVGVGAAFAFHAGMVRRAPVWMQRAGLEWLHRFASEPRRLARRYLVTNTRFVVGAALVLGARR